MNQTSIYLKTFKQLNIQHPQKGKIKFKLYPFQKVILEAFIKKNKLIINKCRQIGMSTMLMAFAYINMILKENYCVLVKGINQNNVQYLMKKFLFFVKESNFIRINTKEKIEFVNGSCIYFESRVTNGRFNQNNIDLIILDEFIFTDDYIDFLTFNSGKESTKVICASTTKRMKKNPFRHIRKFLGKNKSEYIKIPWYQHPEFNEHWAQNMKNAIGVEEFGCEYECRHK